MQIVEMVDTLTFQYKLTLEHIQKAINKVKVKKVERNGVKKTITGKAVKEICLKYKKELEIFVVKMSNKLLLIPEEVCGLRWEDIDFEAIEDSGKTPHALGQLPLGDFLSNILKAKYQQYLDKGIIL